MFRDLLIQGKWISEQQSAHKISKEDIVKNFEYFQSKQQRHQNGLTDFVFWWFFFFFLFFLLENKARQIFQKTNDSYPLTRTRTRAA